jgi:hypothetical protein
MAHTATADAVIGCFDAKYHYTFWRPVHAIARAGTDPNPATHPDPTWTALLTVNHPEYPSAHGCWTTALVHTLGVFFGTDRVRLARIAGGLHFRHSMGDGEDLGRRVAHHVTRHHFQPR